MKDMNKAKQALGALLLSCAVFGASTGSAERIYYINPDGGQYLHSDPQCSTISSKYRPIMEPLSPEELKEKTEYRRLCRRCCVEKNNKAAFFDGKDAVAGCFDVTEKAADRMEFYLYCYHNAESYIIGQIGERNEQYKILVEGGDGRWGYPDEDDISRDMAIAIGYAALQEYIGIGDDDLCLYLCDPWLDVQSYDFHEWRIGFYPVLHTQRFYNSTGYIVFIHAGSGLISRIEDY